MVDTDAQKLTEMRRQTWPVRGELSEPSQQLAGFLDTSQNPVRELYFGEFIAALDLALSLSRFEAMKFDRNGCTFSERVSRKPSSQG